MKRLTSQIEYLTKYEPDILKKQEDSSYIVVLDQLEVCCNGDGTFDEGWMKSHNIKYKQGNIKNCGSVVLAKGSIILDIMRRNTNGTCLSDAFSKALCEFLQSKGLPSVHQKNNDVLVDGFKVASGADITIGICQYMGYQISINQDLDVIKHACTKPMEKIPKALSEYGITTEEMVKFCEDYWAEYSADCYSYKEYEFNCGLYTMTPDQYKKMIDLLEELRPKRICELGSGQSTKIFETYQNKNTDVALYSIEHDPCFNTHKSIILTPLLENTEYLQYSGCVIYQNFDKWLVDQDNFDFVLIDGPNDFLPIGINNPTYSRIQMLSFVNKLNPGAIVMYHDSNFVGADSTLCEFEKILDFNRVRYDKETITETDKRVIEYNTKVSGLCPELTVYKLK